VHFWRGRPGGAEVELTVLFVDVRGSTPLAESMSSGDFSGLMSRFYKAATAVLVRTDAYVDKFVGDEVMAVYLPLFAGSNPARQAVRAAAQLLEATGHGSEEGPWLSVGIGVHTGLAFFGTVAGADSAFSDFTALGDTVNVAARLVGEAQAGEALVSEATAAAAGFETSPCERRALTVKGKSEPIHVCVLNSLTEVEPALLK
jgi:adenylate cyclase